MKIPGLILKQMYTLGSLENTEDGIRFSLKNRLSNATVTRLQEVRIDGQPVPLDRLTLEMGGERIAAASISPTSALAFPLAKVVTFHARTEPLEKGQHEIGIAFDSTPFGELSFKVKDAIAEKVKRTGVPHDKDDDYSPADHQGAPDVRRGVHGQQAGAHRQVLLRPGPRQGQHRELHRRGPGADRLRRPAAGQRRACPGRLHRAPGHRRGHPGGLLQPRHEGAQPLGRRHCARWSATACSGRPSSCSTTPATPATSSSGWTPTSTRSAKRPRRPRRSPS